jgi:transposase
MSEHDRLEHLTRLLNLPDFQVVHERRDTPTDPLQLTVRPLVAVGVCPKCGRPCDTLHRTSESAAVKDLPLGPQAVELRVRTYQFHCSPCQTYFTPDYPAFAPGAHATERFLAHAAKLIRFADLANAAAFLGVPEKNLQRWYYDYVARQATAPAPGAKPITSLGIDELSLKKSIVSSSP